MLPGSEGQSEVSLISDPEAIFFIMAWSHTSIEFDHEILSTVILLHPLMGCVSSYKQRCVLEVLANPLVKHDQEKCD